MIKRFNLLFISLFITSIALASNSQQTQYQLYFNEVPLGMANLEISTPSNKQYKVAIVLDNPIPGIPIDGSLQSAGIMNKGYPQPEKYTFKLIFNQMEKDKTLNFNWITHKVTNPKKERSSSITDNTYDRLSMLLALQQDLRKNRQPLDYKVTNGKHIDNYQFKRLEPEEITTPAGIFATTVVESENDQGSLKLWFAQDENYLPVQAEVQVDNNLTIKASLK